MKPARSILCAALAVTMGGLPTTLQAAGPATTVPAEVAPVAQISDARLASLVQAIRQSQDPSAAIQAYRDAAAVAPTDLAVEQAYVARMVDFGLPEIADVQAQDVIRRDPQDGVAWAVAAYMSAKRDQNELAIRDVAMAVRLQPNNPFVLRTAGQLVAWYDKADKARIPSDVQASVGPIKTQLAGNPAYADAYSRASDALREIAAAPTTQPAAPSSTYTYTPSETPTTNPDVSTYTYTPSPGSYSTTPDTYYPAPSYYYPDPYVSSPYYQSWWPAPVWGGAFWWPTFTSVVIVDKNVSHCNPHKFNHCFNNGNDVFVGRHGAFNGRHGNDFAFTRTNNGNAVFASHNNRGTGQLAARSGTTFARADGSARTGFVGPTVRDGRVSVPANRMTTMNRTAIAPTNRMSANRTMIAPTRQTPVAGGGGRQFAPPPARVGPSGPVQIGRPGGGMPSRPPMSAPSGGARFGGGGGGGGHFGGGGGHVVAGGGGGHFGGGGGGGHFGGGGARGGR